MNLAITGTSTLAEATYRNCLREHDAGFGENVTREPNADTEILWCCWDTPSLNGHEPDVNAVMAAIALDLTKTPKGALVIVSSQIPIGTMAYLEAAYKDNYIFAHIPENVRARQAEQDFSNQSRIVVGCLNRRYDHIFKRLLSPFTSNIIFTDPETSEAVKPALNGLLAMLIAYINEIAAICEKEGVDPHVVSNALKTDARVSENAPLTPGAPYSSGHLEREIHALNALAKKHNLTLPIIQNIRASNERPRN